MKKHIGIVLLLAGIGLFSCAGGPPSKPSPAVDNKPTRVKPAFRILEKPEKIKNSDGSVTVAEIVLANGDKIQIKIMPLGFRGSASQSETDEYDVLIAVVSAVIDKNPGDIGAYIQRASILINRGRTGDLKLAINDCNTVLKIDDSIEEAFYVRGIASAMQGDYEQAVSDMTTLMTIRESKTIGIRYILGQTYYFDGKIPEAIEMFESVVRIDPDFADAASMLAMLRRL
jgi:tetratricopeptide (TPR) repeat protein